jgi:hypothetical protein
MPSSSPSPSPPGGGGGGGKPGGRRPLVADRAGSMAPPPGTLSATPSEKAKLGREAGLPAGSFCKSIRYALCSVVAVEATAVPEAE